MKVDLTGQLDMNQVPEVRNIKYTEDAEGATVDAFAATAAVAAAAATAPYGQITTWGQLTNERHHHRRDAVTQLYSIHQIMPRQMICPPEPHSANHVTI